MNQLLFDRSTGVLGPQAFARLETTRLIRAIQYAPNIKFLDRHLGSVAGGDGSDTSDAQILNSNSTPSTWSHQAGVNALVIDQFEGRLLLSGGADSSIKVWDLHKITTHPKAQVLVQKSDLPKSSTAHRYGITSLSFYPFDSEAFLSSSYDHTLKLYATESLALSASFDLDSIIYTHSLSPIASHLLVACATQHPAIRLVDLRSGSNAHSLAGHQGAVLSVAWSSTKEYILASGGIDGTARIWDVRKSSGTLGLLDIEDSIGILGHDGLGQGWTSRISAKAHTSAVNGISWTDNGSYIITAGHDERMRVWDAATGANTLASFGPTLKNSHLSTVTLMSTPTALTPPGEELLFYPNEHEILLFELHEGRLLKRLKIPGPTTAALRSRTGERNVRNRVTSLAWRGASEGFCSGHTDGLIRAWVPRTRDDEIADAEEEEEGKEGGAGGGDGDDDDDDDDGGARKRRRVLDEVYRDLTRAKITFG